MSVSCLRVLETYEELEICYIPGTPACFELPLKNTVKASGMRVYEIYHEFLPQKDCSRVQEYKLHRKMSSFADRVFCYPVSSGTVYAGIRKSTEYVENSASIAVYAPADTEDCFEVVQKILAESRYDFAKSPFSETLANIAKAIPQSILAHFYVKDSRCVLNLYGTRAEEKFNDLFSAAFDPDSVPVWKNGMS